MEYLSVFDMFKVGIGPSSSHTLGPWQAARLWATSIVNHKVESITITLYGSLSLTGKGHCTDMAIFYGLHGLNPETCTAAELSSADQNLQQGLIVLNGEVSIPFQSEDQLIFSDEFLPYHPNGMTFSAFLSEGRNIQETYYSIGGGFIERGKEKPIQDALSYPYPINSGKELTQLWIDKRMTITEIVDHNERLHKDRNYRTYLLHIWEVMLASIYSGCTTFGTLPGGLNVKRRASDMVVKMGKEITSQSPDAFLKELIETKLHAKDVFRWVSAFALAVNEENAAMGRVVTAPTNGSAGVIPAVLMYYILFIKDEAVPEEIIDFLAVASEIGCIVKKKATISAAMGGCQAEIGVSSAMAAGALAFMMGADTEQVLIASEIAMEHHLGLTCDPINGLVQVPCIERNSMGAIKAINAANMAINRDPKNTLVPFDRVVKVMWETAQDMNVKYKETSLGGLASPVNEVEC